MRNVKISLLLHLLWCFFSNAFALDGVDRAGICMGGGQALFLRFWTNFLWYFIDLVDIGQFGSTFRTASRSHREMLELVAVLGLQNLWLSLLSITGKRIVVGSDFAEIESWMILLSLLFLNLSSDWLQVWKTWWTLIVFTDLLIYTFL